MIIVLLATLGARSRQATAAESGRNAGLVNMVQADNDVVHALQRESLTAPPTSHRTAGSGRASSAPPARPPTRGSGRRRHHERPPGDLPRVPVRLEAGRRGGGEAALHPRYGRCRVPVGAGGPRLRCARGLVPRRRPVRDRGGHRPAGGRPAAVGVGPGRLQGGRGPERLAPRRWGRAGRVHRGRPVRRLPGGGRQGGQPEGRPRHRGRQGVEGGIATPSSNARNDVEAIGRSPWPRAWAASSPGTLQP